MRLPAVAPYLLVRRWSHRALSYSPPPPLPKMPPTRDATYTMSARVHGCGDFWRAAYSAGQVGAAITGQSADWAALMPSMKESTADSSFGPSAPARLAALAIWAAASAGV